MVHIGSAPPDLADILSCLEKGDVLTHCFNGKENGILDRQSNTIKSFVLMLMAKVLLLILVMVQIVSIFGGRKAYAANLKAASISTDIYIRNRMKGPVYDLATTMEKLAVVGYSWQEIIEKVTLAPARQFQLKGKGAIEEEMDADFTIFEFKEAAKVLIDSDGNKRSIDRQIIPLKTIIGGQVYDIESD